MRWLKTEHHAAQGGDVLLVTLDRPDVLNAINAEMLDELERVTRRACADPATRAIVVTGAGRAFSAGADIAEFAGLDATGAEALMRRGQEVFQALEDAPVPVVAAVNGYALGGGLELALACDIRLASDAAKLGQPEATLANLPGWGGTQRLPRVVGEPRAKDLIFSGRVIDAAEALAMGLVHAIYPPQDLLEAALAYASRLLPAGRTALGLAKRAIHAARADGMAGYAVERQSVAICFTTDEQRAAVERFVTKGKAS
jgi:enoyl-CoA hydratase